MALITLRQLLDHAAEYNYGVPAFNINNLEQIQAIMQAAKRPIRRLFYKPVTEPENMQEISLSDIWSMGRLKCIQKFLFACIKIMAMDILLV